MCLSSHLPVRPLHWLQVPIQLHPVTGSLSDPFLPGLYFAVSLAVLECVAPSSALKMDTAESAETSVAVGDTAWQHIPKSIVLLV